MSGHRYQPFYCEENAWFLAGEARFLGKDCRVAVITSAGGVCPFLCHRRERRGGVTWWDYHVVVLERRMVGWVVWDLDSRLTMPVRLDRYLKKTFGLARVLPEEFAPRFRVLTAERYRQVFSSDRSHMVDMDGAYLQPPPPWRPILRDDGVVTLRRLIDVADGFEGVWVGLEELVGSLEGRGGPGGS